VRGRERKGAKRCFSASRAVTAIVINQRCVANKTQTKLETPRGEMG